MPHNENSRVKIPALVHFTRLGYKYISLRKYEGVIDDDTNILVDVLCDAINRINATSLTTTDTQKIVNALKAMLENDDLGREFYSVLINGYNGLKLIDFEDFGGTVNYYHVVTEMTCKNGSDEFRPDITPLINGLPLAFIEVKKPNNKGGIKAEYDRMLMRVKNKKFRRFINLTQIMVFSNNSEYDDTEAVPLEGASFTPDKLKGYYRRFFNRVVDKPSLLFIFTVTCVYTQPCYQAENEVLKFHMQEAFQRIQMDTRPDGFATMIMDELNQDKVKQLKDACHRMMVEGDFVKYENVYHGVLTECSSQSTGIQLADYAVGIMNCYLRKHLMSRGDYTFATDLYTEFVLPHLRKHANGTIVGYGVREVPSDSSIRQVLIPLFN